jgi:Fe-S oxidoreductase
MRESSGTYHIEYIFQECVNCKICVEECAFLQEYGSPQNLAADWLEKREITNSKYVFDCSLCGLCHGVCPKNLDPSAMFLSMRRELVAEDAGTFKQHKTIRTYEKRGSSSLFSWFHFPVNCDTVLFPGCAFPGSRPETLTRLFYHLQKMIPNIGIVLDCCTKPSHDLGDNVHFTEMFNELNQILCTHSIRKVLTVCPNCYRIFKEYGQGIEVQIVYENLSLTGVMKSSKTNKEVTVHDPCGVRFAKNVQQSVRNLLQEQGLAIREMKHNRTRTFCCGEGGAAGFLRPDFAKFWTKKRVEEAGSSEIVCYCAGCTHFLGESSVTHHILDLCFFQEAVLAGKQKVSRAPFTYWNRYRLKRALKKNLQACVSGTRTQLRN